MAYSSVDRSIWNDRWLSSLGGNRKGRDARELFIYSFTNDHMNPAGLYEVTLDVMAREAGFRGERDPAFIGALAAIASRVIYYPEHGLAWVKNYIKRQPGARNDHKYMAGVAKVLRGFGDIDPVRDLVAWNARQGLKISKALPRASLGPTQGHRTTPLPSTPLKNPSAAGACARARDSASKAGLSKGAPAPKASLISPGEGGNGKDPAGKPTAADLDHIRRLKADPERWKLLSRATQRRYEATLEAAEAGP